MSKTVTKNHSLKSVTDFIGISRQAFHKRLARNRNKSDLYNYAEGKVLKNRRVKSRAGLRSIYYKEQLTLLLGINQFEQQMSINRLCLKTIQVVYKNN